MKKNYRARVLKEKIGKVISLIFLLVVVGGAVSTVRSIRSLQKTSLRIAEAQMRVEALRKENDELAKRIEMVESDEFREFQIRNNLGMVKEGEIVVVLPDAEIVKKFSPNISSGADESNDPNWIKWMKFFHFW
jgi:cell division protein FtsB